MDSIRINVLIALIALLVSSCIASSLPVSFDTRQQWPQCGGYILDQQSCGSCWAFAATTVLTDRFCIHTSAVSVLNNTSNRTLSPQQLVSCAANLGCDGGAELPAWEFLKNHGLAPCTDACTTGCLPYISGNCTEGKDRHFDGCTQCPKTCASGDSFPYRFRAATFEKIWLWTPQARNDIDHPLTSIDTSNRNLNLNRNHNNDGLTPETEAMMREIQANGPIEVCFMIHQNFYDFFNTYPTGVYDTTNHTGRAGAHCVTIRGWGVQDNKPYWLIANSWGPSFGDHGYFRFLRGSNLCWMESLVYAGCPNPDWPNGTSSCKLTNPRANDTDIERNIDLNRRPFDELPGAWIPIKQNAISEKIVALIMQQLPLSVRSWTIKSIESQVVNGWRLRLRLAFESHQIVALFHRISHSNEFQLDSISKQ